MTRPRASPQWSTVWFGGSTATSPMEPLPPGEHLSPCQDMHGRFLMLRCAGERVNFASG